MNGKWEKQSDLGYATWHLRIGDYEHALVQEQSELGSGVTGRISAGPASASSVYIVSINGQWRPGVRFGTPREAMDMAEDAMIQTAKKVLAALRR